MSLTENAMAPRPPRLTIVNLDNLQTLEAQFNPSKLTEQFAANWTRLNVPGLGYQPLQFQNSDNAKLTFELFLTTASIEGWGSVGGGAEQTPPQLARRLLASWTKPRQVSNDIIGGSPPPLRVVWPQIISFDCVLLRVELDHKAFDLPGNLGIARSTARIELEEISDVQITMDSYLDDESRWGGFSRDVLDAVDAAIDSVRVGDESSLFSGPFIPPDPTR